MPKDWRTTSATPAFKKDEKELGNYRSVCITSVPGKVMEQLVLDVITKHTEEKVVIWSSQCGFTKRKSCLTNLVDFCDVIASWVDEGEQWMLRTLTSARL